MGLEILFLAIGVFVSILAGWAGLRAGPTQKATILTRRLDQVIGAKSANENASAVQLNLRRDDFEDGGKSSGLARFIPRLSKLQTRLIRTGRQISVTTYVIISLLIMALTGGVSHAVVGLPLISSIFLTLMLGALLPHLAVGMMAKRRMAQFNDQFPNAIDLMVRGLRSGLPVTECVKIVGSEVPDPVGSEFCRVTDAVRFGSKLSDALWVTARRLDLPEFKFFVVSLSVQQETGGNLAETLANLSEILRRRRQMRLKIKAMSSEAKASAMILGALPFIMFGIIYLMNPEYASTLFTDPRGRIILAGGLLTMTCGIFVMSRMVRFEI